MNLYVQLSIELMKKNIRQTKTMMYIVFAFLLWTFITNTAGRLYIYPQTIPFFTGYIPIYSILLVVNILGFYFIHIKKWTVSKENLRASLWLFAVYNGLILLCMTTITITDALILGHVAVFEMFFLLATVLYSIPFRYIILIASIITPAVIVAILISPHIEQNYSYILCGNVIIFAIVGVFCSHTVTTIRKKMAQQELLLRNQHNENNKLMEQLEQQNKQLSNLMQHDPLTGLFNRRAFNEYIQKLTQEGAVTVTFLMMDIDCFKRYNDYYGHIGGDAILTKVANILQTTAAASDDFVARWGGEEFMYITLHHDVENLAQTIIQRVRHAAIPHKMSTVAPYVTVSIGVYTAQLEPHVPLSHYCEAVDKALYQSKHNGRNRYTFYTEELAYP